MRAIEQWVEKYFDRQSASMPGSSISVTYVPKQENIPACPDDDASDLVASKTWPWTMISVVAAIGASLVTMTLLMV